ncbi:MAG: hypothetical protein WA924_16980 [Burkholderiaceae bacterium]
MTGINSDLWRQWLNLYECRDTRRVFHEDYSDGIYSMLSPWHAKGRYGKFPLRLKDSLKALLSEPPRAKIHRVRCADSLARHSRTGR